ncbi:MAG: hypothetical protein N2246_05250 [Candidatus Sumerlaeia bacterium]|nr:hypothetical protein [Candidatus Sumerlaeia bacterium]
MTTLKSFGLLYGVLIFASLCSLASSESVSSSQSRVIFSTTWGDQPGECGLINQPELERCGPISFCVDDKHVFLLDTVNQRILSFDENAGAKILATNITGSNICPDRNGGVFVLQEGVVKHIDKRGRIANKISLIQKSVPPSQLIEGYGVEMFVDSLGHLCYRSLTQEVRRLTDAPLFKTADPPGKPQSPLHYQVKRMLKNEVWILGMDTDGKALISVPVRLNDGQAGVCLFKGLDANGNLYVEVENIRENKAGLEVHCYSTSGKKLRAFKLPNDYFTTVYKKTEISYDGAVYQMLTTPEGVSIIRYEQEGRYE